MSTNYEKWTMSIKSEQWALIVEIDKKNIDYIE